MKRSSKRLSHIFIRELVGIRNILGEMGDIDDLHMINPELAHAYLVIDDLLDWADNKYNINHESKKWYKYPEYKDFMKFHAQLCYDCEEVDIDYYMIKDNLWDEYGSGDYFLCIPCLEKRMGRELEAKDFTNCMANDDCERVQEIRHNKWKVN